MGRFFLQKSKKAIILTVILSLVCVSLGVNIGSVSAASEPTVEINGFKISTTYEGFRTIYSVSDPQSLIDSCGLIYGLEGYSTESEIVVGSSNEDVYDYQATELGKLDECYSELESPTSYAMTMKLIDSKDYYGTNMMIRAYAKLNDGSIVYSDVVYASVFSVADYLYTHDQMGTMAGHTYLYENILKVVEPNYTEVDYHWTGTIVKPGNIPDKTETFTVNFVDYDGSLISTQTVNKGESATAPSNPARDGYIFVGWNQSFDNVISDMEVVAQYQKITTPTLMVNNVTSTAGATNVEVTVNAINNPGIAGMTLSLEYDDSVLTLTKVTSGDAMSGLTFQKPKTYKDGCNLVWYGAEPDEVVDGTAFTLVFSISEDAQAGEYPVTLTYSTGYDSELNSIDMAIVNGNIVIN